MTLLGLLQSRFVLRRTKAEGVGEKSLNGPRGFRVVAITLTSVCYSDKKDMVQQSKKPMTLDIIVKRLKKGTFPLYSTIIQLPVVSTVIERRFDVYTQVYEYSQHPPVRHDGDAPGGRSRVPGSFSCGVPSEVDRVPGPKVRTPTLHPRHSGKSRVS